MSIYDIRLRCRCGWEGNPMELKEKVEFWGNQEEPPEYSDWCPDCGRNADEMEEIDEYGESIES